MLNVEYESSYKVQGHLVAYVKVRGVTKATTTHNACYYTLVMTAVVSSANI